ncbi:presenilins-associated rhomboid-like protein, mitochondrial isoform X1 [Cotesia glomerata]|uniref:rhomboid protease n=1 Tax=Cotesia glomerata TaxID=32391 RepID=A0AAV7J4S5_COTGL|nr:presenilins-associated rhomboid-like protein, mitochondrial isoform X1 [Cotesia glomerata]KAH0564716.1 hypothetical protein KQX54_013562 [Cotesia glomerata]
MAFRRLLCLNETAGKSLFNNVSCQKIISEVPNSFKSIRSFKRLRDTHDIVHTSELTVKNLWKPLGFTILFGSAAHLGAAIWEYEKIRSYKLNSMKKNNINEKIRSYLQSEGVVQTWRGKAQSWWRNLSNGERIFVPICYLNVMVFLAWRVPAFRATMTKYFCANPASSAICWPMVLSTFSHHSLLHLGTNMYVLHSFSTAAVGTLGTEQFVALYLTSGVLSSFASHLFKVVFQRPGLSLGASGAILGVVAFICAQYPDTRLGIAFLPMITFTAGNAIKGLLAFDVIGCVMRWRFLDHAAHLGGAMWGLYWQMWGNSQIWQNRKSFLNLWHSFRDPPRSHRSK